MGRSQQFDTIKNGFKGAKKKMLLRNSVDIRESRGTFTNGVSKKLNLIEEFDDVNPLDEDIAESYFAKE